MLYSHESSNTFYLCVYLIDYDTYFVFTGCISKTREAASGAHPS